MQMMDGSTDEGIMEFREEFLHVTCTTDARKTHYRRVAVAQNRSTSGRCVGAHEDDE